MILKLLPISLLQCLLLTGGQVLMKYGLTKVGAFSFTWVYQLAVHLLWLMLWCWLCTLDVYHQALPVQHGISDG